MVSPCEPSVSVRTEPTGTPSSSATKWLKRAVSSMPACPITRLLGSPETAEASAVISSSGFDTTMSTASGDAGDHPLGDLPDDASRSSPAGPSGSSPACAAGRR